VALDTTFLAATRTIVERESIVRSDDDDDDDENEIDENE